MLKHDLHRPYQELYTTLVCNKKGHRSKMFSKEFFEKTRQREDEFRVTCRRCRPFVGEENGLWRYDTPDRSEILATVDNSRVVPYCPTLSNMCQCLINVKLSISWIRGMEYLRNYMCKGFDGISISLAGGQRDYDEISTLEKARNVFDSEAVGTLLQLYIDE